MLHVSGPADVVLGSAALRSLPGPLVTLESQGGDPSVTFENSLIEGTLGPVVVGVGDVHVVETEISAATVYGGQAIIDTEAGTVTLRHSAIFGSVIEDAPLIRSTGPLLIAESLVADNVVVGGGPLLDARAFPVAAASGGQGLQNSVFSDNGLVVSGGAATAPPLPERTGGLLQQPCLPYGSLGFGFDGRDTPQWSGAPSDAPILSLTGAAPGAEFPITRNFFVETSAGLGSAIVALASEGSAIWLTLLHNTIGASSGRLVAGAEAPAGTHVSAARNLLTTAFSIETNPQWAGIESSLDLDLSGAEPPPAATVGLSILGPYLYADELLAEPWFHSDVATWSHWERVQAACPDLPGAGPGQDLWALPCLLGSAANYVPTQDFIDTYALPWPWEGAYFGDFPAGHPSNTPGATGWACRGFDPAPYDNHVVGGFGVGDGDGFSSLLDCANEDDAVGPALPNPDGFGEVECLEVEGDCYQCPKGSEPPGDDDSSDDSGDDDSGAGPPADDDSSTGPPGDDDSASAVDDPSPSGDAPIRYIHTGCGQHKGCGVAFSCADGGLSLAVLLPLWARRGRRKALPGRGGD